MKQLLPDLSTKERLMILQENAQKIEQTTYQKNLTDEELAARREDLAENHIKLGQYDDEAQEFKHEFKKKVEPLRNSNRIILQEIKTKQTSVDGTLFHMANHEDGMMETYDQEGVMISSRRLRPDERQGAIFTLKTAANS
jgi:hypothetical protein